MLSRSNSQRLRPDLEDARWLLEQVWNLVFARSSNCLRLTLDFLIPLSSPGHVFCSDSSSSHPTYLQQPLEIPLFCPSLACWVSSSNFCPGLYIRITGTLKVYGCPGSTPGCWDPFDVWWDPGIVFITMSSIVVAAENSTACVYQSCFP